jgi:excisionase family DNA binding protein
MRNKIEFVSALSRVTELLPSADPDRAALEELRSLLVGDTVTTGEAADLLGLRSKNTVKALLESGKVEGAIQTPGGHWRIPPSAILEYRAEQLRARESGSLRPSRLRRETYVAAGSEASSAR